MAPESTSAAADTAASLEQTQHEDRSPCPVFGQTLLEAALYYASRGFFVFPVAEDGKAPLTPHGYLDATIDPDRITAWWTKYPRARIGCACRRSGFITIDVDGDRGIQELAELEAELGPLPRVFVQKTGGKGGLHILVKDPCYDLNRDHSVLVSDICGNLGGAGVIDVKCNGFIILSPSANGKYSWLSFDADKPIPPLPLLWRLRIVKLGRSPSTASTEIPTVIEGELAERVESGRTAIAAHAARFGNNRLIQVLAGKGGENCGSGNIRVGKIAWTIGIAAPDIGADAAIEIMRGCLEQISGPDAHSPSRLIDRARQSYNDGVARGTSQRAEAEAAKRFFDGWMCDHTTQRGLAASCPECDDVLDNPDDATPGTWNHTLRQARRDVDKALGETRDDDRTPLCARWVDFEVRSFPETVWTVEQLIREGGTALLNAGSKMCKSWKLTEVARAVASGMRAFGEFKTNDTGRRVHYIYMEDTGRDIQRHVAALAKGVGMSDEQLSRMRQHLHVQESGKFLDVLKPEDMAWIVASVRQHGGTDLLCIEPLRDIHGGKENESDDMRDVMRKLRIIRTLLGCTLVTAHHDKQSTGNERGMDRSRGSGAIKGAIDSSISLKPVGGDRVTEFKNEVEVIVRGARAAAPFCLTLNIVDCGTQADVATWNYELKGKGKPEPSRKPNNIENTSVVVEAIYLALMMNPEQPPSTASIRTKTKIGMVGCRDTLQECLEHGLIKPNMRGKRQAGWLLTDAGKRFYDGL